MNSVLYGVWLPAIGWLRFMREEPTGGMKSIAWATLDRRIASQVARELGGTIHPIDDALGSLDAQLIFLRAEEARKGRVTLWHRIRKAFHLVS